MINYSVDKTIRDVSALSSNDLRAFRNCGCSLGCKDACSCLATTDTQWLPELLWIAERWPLLPPHVREAIVTMVDLAARQVSGETS